MTFPFVAAFAAPARRAKVRPAILSEGGLSWR
jgi:hypothetical protein